jgi:ABC-type enterochelin transport system ATPase subunit
MSKGGLMDNPFNISFGKKPYQYISRFMQSHKVIDTFTSENPSTNVYLITGLRGSGKTVLMTEIEREFKEEDWITIELNPEQDLLEDLASKLYSIPKLKNHFTKAKLDLSLFGLGISIEDGNKQTNVEAAIGQMLEILKKQKKYLLITIDEVTNSQNIKAFAHAFQIYLRQEHNIFLIMTGLYENIFNLQNEKTLTFLYRAPKIYIEPLNRIAIMNSYKELFNISEAEAGKMAALTNGYAFAYQLLGYIKWENKDKQLEELMPEYDQYLQDFVYEKIWSELSEKDRYVITEISKAVLDKSSLKVGDLLKNTGMSASLFSNYRDRLLKKGIIDTSKYGYISLTLPRFAKYVTAQALIEGEML